MCTFQGTVEINRATGSRQHRCPWPTLQSPITLKPVLGGSAEGITKRCLLWPQSFVLICCKFHVVSLTCSLVDAVYKAVACSATWRLLDKDDDLRASHDF